MDIFDNKNEPALQCDGADKNHNMERRKNSDFSPKQNEMKSIYLIMAKEGLRSFSRYNLNMYYRIFADKKYDADVEAELKAIVEENGRTQMEIWKAFYDEWNSAMTLTRGACYAFLGILGAICIMNMINTMIHSVHVRRKEIGMLQAVGMSDLQLVKMQSREVCIDNKNGR